jgi:hypothetical protein
MAALLKHPTKWQRRGRRPVVCALSKPACRSIGATLFSRRIRGDVLKLLFVLRAGGYNGSTYTLDYDPANDQLKGDCYQAVARQKFEVVFTRAQ